MLFVIHLIQMIIIIIIFMATVIVFLKKKEIGTNTIKKINVNMINIIIGEIMQT
jgi:hypothetical protein